MSQDFGKKRSSASGQSRMGRAGPRFEPKKSAPKDQYFGSGLADFSDYFSKYNLPVARFFPKKLGRASPSRPWVEKTCPKSGRTGLILITSAKTQNMNKKEKESEHRTVSK